jgi:hypothetical protein
MTSPRSLPERLQTGERRGRHRPTLTTSGKRMQRLGAALAVSPVVLGSAAGLQAPPNLFDGGTLLTMARFATDGYFPYRDIWTLYGPGTSLIGSITTPLLGPGALATGITHILISALLVLGVYALSSRYVHWALAAVFAASVATIATPPHHFTQSLVVLIWGVWFVASASNGTEPSVRKLSIGAALIGSSFLGRYELAAVTPLLIVWLWWFLRPTLRPQFQRWILVAGLAPPALFGIYLVGVVGWDAAYLNLVDYPLHFYSKPYCRGLSTPWAEAFSNLFNPIRGRLWTPHELTLGTGTYIPPILGTLTLWSGWRRRQTRSVEVFSVLLVGALTWLIWLEMRPRAGPTPEPTWPFMLASSAILLSLLRSRNLRLAGAFGLAAAGMIMVTVLVGWLPGKAAAWKSWPQFHRLYAFATLEAEGLYNERIWEGVTRTVHTYAAPGDPIFVALNENRGHFANTPAFYWFVDRPPVSRFIEFDPCLTDTAGVQRLIVQDLPRTNVVITTTFFPNQPPPLGPPTTILDDYLNSSFRKVFEERLAAPEPGAFRQAFSVLIRQGIPPLGGQRGAPTE